MTSERSELDHVIEKIIPIMHEIENGSIDLDAKKLAVEYPAPMQKLIEVFGPVAVEHKLHIHIEERSFLEIQIDFMDTKIKRLPPKPPTEWYHITWHHKNGDGCDGRHPGARQY